MGRTEAVTHDEFDIKWAQRTDFAEVAEVIGVNTDMILAMHSLPGTDQVFVMFTYPTDTGKVYRCTLREDGDHVLHRYKRPVEVPGFYEQLMADVSRSVKRKLGKPKGKRHGD
jgi:hypothetical protein